MKNNNAMLYQAIINSLPRNNSEQLRQLMSEFVIDGKTRTIRHAGRSRDFVERDEEMVDTLKRGYSSPK